MQKRSHASLELSLKSPCRTLAFVPFSWEEKPGLPKKQESKLLDSCIHFPVPPCMQHHGQLSAISPLRKPPRLQQHNYGPLCKTPSFNSISVAPRVSCSKVLVRRQSFDNIIYAGDWSPIKEYSYDSLIVDPRGGQPATLIKMEDDPFFMAIQACRKEPIRVFYHHDRSTRGSEEERAAGGKKSSRVSHVGEEGFKHHTIRQLFSQQSQAEDLQDDEHQPLDVEKKHANRLLKCVTGCFGCC